MSKRVFIVHGWDDSPKGSWFPWAKKELQKMGFTVKVPTMPDPHHPNIETWRATLEKAVGTVDQQTYFVGHSVGCQTILRYLEKLPSEVRTGGVVMVAGWLTLTPEALPDEEYQADGKPWLESPIHWKKVLSHGRKFTYIYSDNDPYVTVDNAGQFQKHLQAKLILETNKKHFSAEDGVTELPVVLKAILEMAQ